MSDDRTRNRTERRAAAGLTSISESPAAPPKVAILIAQAQAAEAAAEEARVYQLAFWPDDARAMPFDFVACALFTAIQDKDTTWVDGEEIANANGYRITYKGKRLTQVHADVWQGIMHLARATPQDTKVRFKARAFLRLIGRHTGKAQRVQLHRWITDLVATNVEIIDTGNANRLFFGSMLPEGARDAEQGGDAAYVVKINRNLCKLFDKGFATVNWEQRRKLQSKRLALWLNHYFSRFTKPVPVSELCRLSGSGARSMRHFRERLREALVDLREAGGHAAYVDQEADVVRPIPEESLRRTPALGVLPQLPFTVSVPQASELAKQRYTQLYGRDDVEDCVAAWQRWLEKSGRTADKPDQAFLGFARRYVQGR
jgi:TrfA protein